MCAVIVTNRAMPGLRNRPVPLMPRAGLWAELLPRSARRNPFIRRGKAF